MAFSFDSRLAIAAALLFAAAVMAWRLTGGRAAPLRLNLRFAAVLFAALGVAGLAASLSPPLVEACYAVAMLVTALGGAVLALSLVQPRPAPPLAAGAALVAALAAGLVSILMGAPVFTLGCVTLSAAAMLPIGLARGANLRAVEIVAGALALFVGGMALAGGALAGALILFAAALLGLACASQLGVQHQADKVFLTAAVIGRPRL